MNQQEINMRAYIQTGVVFILILLLILAIYGKDGQAVLLLKRIVIALTVFGLCAKVFDKACKSKSSKIDTSGITNQNVMDFMAYKPLELLSTDQLVDSLIADIYLFHEAINFGKSHTYVGYRNHIFSMYLSEYSPEVYEIYSENGLFLGKYQLSDTQKEKLKNNIAKYSMSL